MPGNLFIEEFGQENNATWEEILYRHPNKGGWYFWPRGGALDGKLFDAEEISFHTYSEIHATLDDQLIFSTKCEISTLRAVITAWTYNNHWIIQSYCHDKYEIIWDGTFIDETRGYQSSYAFQLMDGRPFYLFTRKESVWLFFDDQEIPLGYDRIEINYCCESPPPPQHYERMILFTAIKEDKKYTVVIGINKY
jgi:hypothetical protein